MVTWREIDRRNNTGATTIRAQTFDREFNAISPRLVIATYKRRAVHTALSITDPASTTLAGRRFVMVWREGDKASVFEEGIYARVYSIDGQPTTHPFPIARSRNRTLYENPEVAELNDNGFVITWIEGGSVFAQCFDYLGKKINRKLVVNEIGLDPRYAPPIGFVHGSFAVPWYGCEFETNGCAYYSRTFNKDGKPFGGSEQIYYYAPTSPKVSSNVNWLNE